MSLTFGGLLVAVGGTVLLNFGFSEVCSNEILTIAPTAVGSLIAWIGRVRAGGVTWFGAKV